MPNIREYTSKGSLAPDERGMQALARQAGAKSIMAGASQDLGQAGVAKANAYAGMVSSVGKTAGSVISEVGQTYVQYKTNQEVSRAVAAQAGILGDLNAKWDRDRTAADPNDTSIAPAFLEKDVEPTLAKFVEGFSTEEGQKWAQNQVASMRQHFFEKTAADEAIRAGQAAVQNMDVLKNRASNNVFTDPSSLNMNLGLIDIGIEAAIQAAPGIDPVKANELRTTLRQSMKSEATKSAVLGLAAKDPDVAIARLNAGEFSDYIDGDERRTLVSYAEGLKRAAEQQARSDAVQARQDNIAAANKAANLLAAQYIDPETGGWRIPPDATAQIIAIAQMPDSPPGMAEGLINFNRAMTNELENPVKIDTDPYVYSDFAIRAALPDTDPKALTAAEVRDARMAHKLDDTAFKHFTDLVTKPNSERAAVKAQNDFINSRKSSITSSTFMKVDPLGDIRFQQFQWNATKIWETLKKAGKDDAYIQSAIDATIPRFAVSQQMSQDYMTQMASGGGRPPAPVTSTPGNLIVPTADAGLFGKPAGGKVGPPVGTVRNGYRFIGGDPNAQANWEKVGG